MTMAYNIGYVFLMLVILAGFSGKVSSTYNRPPPGETLFVHRDASHSSTTPEQVHISMVGEDKMRITWITQKSAPSTVEYGTSSGVYNFHGNGSSTNYKYLVYKSGEIHEAVIGPLKPNTIYYYRCSGHSSREFTFKTTVSHLPINFVVVGDLGQTKWTKSTLNHISNTNYDMLLLPGDLSYADYWQPFWDSFGRLVEPLASRRPWMVTHGNHEVEKVPLMHPTSFTAYNARWLMPFKESGSTSNLYYSFDVANHAVHVIMLGSYTEFGPGSSQYRWLEQDLAKIDRKKTPWVVVLVHAPWYNSNSAHKGEKESSGMRNAMEKLIYNARVDIVFAGHVHAYERFTRVYNGKADQCGPVYITIGDGGNREGLAKSYTNPQPKISIFREASFGHAQLEMVNSTHAHWSWHRNDDNQSVSADSVWLTSLASESTCIPTDHSY